MMEVNNSRYKIQHLLNRNVTSSPRVSASWQAECMKVQMSWIAGKNMTATNDSYCTSSVGFSSLCMHELQSRGRRCEYLPSPSSTTSPSSQTIVIGVRIVAPHPRSADSHHTSTAEGKARRVPPRQASALRWG